MDDLKTLWSQVGRLRAAGRRRVETRCLACGALVEGLVTRRYCNQRCAAAYRYREHTEAIKAQRRERYRRQHQEMQP